MVVIPSSPVREDELDSLGCKAETPNAWDASVTTGRLVARIRIGVDQGFYTGSGSGSRNDSPDPDLDPDPGQNEN